MMEVMEESALEQELEEADKVVSRLSSYLIKTYIFVILAILISSTLSRRQSRRCLGTLWGWVLVSGRPFFLW